MLQFIKKNYLSQTKLSHNLLDFSGGITLALFCYITGLNLGANWVIIFFLVSLGIIRAAMAFYCIVKYRKKR